MLVDGVSGLITWSPKNKQAGPVDVTLVVQNDAGSDFQDFTIIVEGGQGQPSCGCGGLQRFPAALSSQGYRPGSSQGAGGSSPVESALPMILCLLVLVRSRKRRAGPKQ